MARGTDRLSGGASDCDRQLDGVRVVIEAQVESEWHQALTDCQVESVANGRVKCIGWNQSGHRVRVAKGTESLSGGG